MPWEDSFPDSMSLRMPTWEIWFSIVATRNAWLSLLSMGLWRTFTVVVLIAEDTSSVLVSCLSTATGTTLLLLFTVVHEPWARPKSTLLLAIIMQSSLQSTGAYALVAPLRLAPAHPRGSFFQSVMSDAECVIEKKSPVKQKRNKKEEPTLLAAVISCHGYLLGCSTNRSEFLRIEQRRATLAELPHQVFAARSRCISKSYGRPLR